MFGMWLIFGYYIYLEVGNKILSTCLNMFASCSFSQGVFAALVDFAWLAYNTYCWQARVTN